jgi:hypothetical protein
VRFPLSLEAPRRELRFLFVCGLLLLATVSIPACGARPPQLQSISVSPAIVDGQVQFTATGYYTDGSKVTPLSALWFTIRPWYNAVNPVQFFNLDETGKASCNGNAGTFSVVATAPIDPHYPLSQTNSATPQVSGMAQLTCQ